MPIQTATIYHNTKCSKSIAALNLLLEHGVEVDIVNYLETPLSLETLKNLIRQLDIEAKQLIRFAEPVAKELKLSINDSRDDNAWLLLMQKNPILIERPIVVSNNKTVIGRPPELVLNLFT
ncbi:MAG: arsenate reductase (glutaredoxin) [Arenimonas sp.]